MPTVNEIKAQLKAMGLPTQGNKTELERRLTNAVANSNSSVSKAPPHSQLMGGDSKRQKMSGSTSSAAAQSQSAHKLQAFENLYDTISGGEEIMEGEKTLEFCDNLGIDPEAASAVAVSYFFQSPSIGIFKRAQFIQGAVNLCVTSLENIKDQLPELVRKASFGGSEYDNVYKFAYGWGCEPGIRNMKKEVAIGLWKLLVPQAAFKHIDLWLKFWESHPARVVTKDEWLSFKRYTDLARSKKDQLGSDDAWPTAIDDFLETLKAKVASS